MPTPSTSDLPKPKSWDEFEDIVCEIYTRRWQNPNVKRYGRSGQAQKGVDIYGQQNGSSKYVAIQCKRYKDKKLDLSTITSEVSEAEQFSSPISEYIIATTISRNTKIQDLVRQLNEERTSENKFSVHIVFWEDLCSYLVEPSNYDLIEKYYSTWKEVFAKPKNIKELFQKELEGIDAQVSQSTLTAPYWRIALSPQTYNAQLLTSRNECDNLIKRTKIQKPEWSYPPSSANSVKGSNWIEVRADLTRHEYWRLYQSGQFINIARIEDPNNIITDEEIIYTVATVFRFAANLCQQEIYIKGINVTIELNNIKGVGLKVKSDLNDLPSQRRKSTGHKHENTWAMQSNYLSSAFDEKGLEAIIWFVECFWSTSSIPIKAFKKKQKELLDS